MSDELFDRIVDQLRGQDVEYLCPYLMADPMSDRKIFERMAIIRRALPATHIEVSTTGLYLIPRIAEKLLAAPLSELRISSHGTTAEEWARTMPGVDYERAWPNLMRFLEAWRQTKPYSLYIVTLWGLWAKQREAEIEAFWRDLDVEIVRWQVISRAGEVDLTVFGEGSEQRAVRSPDKRDPPYRCRFNRDTQWVHILSDGRLTLCCMDYRQEVILGNLLEQTLEEIWRSRAFERVRARVRGDLPTDEQFICERCEWHVSRAAIEVKSSEARPDDRRAATGVESERVGV
jgi:radical SAM protein with 4Fe4S-binding SPASM domain